ncbi:hypothetical protein FRUB_07809 [Fimbriiglobus ruber]|uniref:Uncharacterized protein n=1 Tax=Fimbriiglobus ruber TaxID=1908690 RepID=A0A225DN92_9BACT|nr:hypothetical protein FRUB_07809 [Fimbriiglobus ruber]
MPDGIGFVLQKLMPEQPPPETDVGLPNCGFLTATAIHVCAVAPNVIPNSGINFAARSVSSESLFGQEACSHPR